MAIGLNITEKTAGVLLKQAVPFNSPEISGLRMINTKYYKTTPRNPRIETNQIIGKNGNPIEFSIKKFDNGDKFELYKLPDEVIKILKNKFGEIKAFKSSIKQHNDNPQKTYENAKLSMRSQVCNFLG